MLKRHRLKNVRSYLLRFFSGIFRSLFLCVSMVYWMDDGRFRSKMLFSKKRKEQKATKEVAQVEVK